MRNHSASDGRTVLILGVGATYEVQPLPSPRMVWVRVSAFKNRMVHTLCCRACRLLDQACSPFMQQAWTPSTLVSSLFDCVGSTLKEGASTLVSLVPVMACPVSASALVLVDMLVSYGCSTT